MSSPLEKTVLLACDVARAFELFTAHATEWWPPSRRHTKDPQSTIRIEAGPGARFFERARDGHEVDLGRVALWEPPHRLVLDFYVGTDAEHPTRVEVTFTAEGERARVVVRHGPLPASAELFEQRAPRYEASWSLVLESLAAFAASAAAQ